MIGVVGDITGVALKSLSSGVGEGVPDRGLSTVFIGRAFNLVRGGGAAPLKVRRKSKQTGVRHLRDGQLWQGSTCQGGRCGPSDCSGKLAARECFHKSASVNQLLE